MAMSRAYSFVELLLALALAGALTAAVLGATSQLDHLRMEEAQRRLAEICLRGQALALTGELTLRTVRLEPTGSAFVLTREVAGQREGIPPRLVLPSGCALELPGGVLDFDPRRGETQPVRLTHGDARLDLQLLPSGVLMDP